MSEALKVLYLTACSGVDIGVNINAAKEEMITVHEPRLP